MFENYSLECSVCDDDFKRSAGCCKPPVLERMKDTGDGSYEPVFDRTWDVQWWVRWCERNDMIPDGTAARQMYYLANAGNTAKHLGVSGVWPMCPRSYDKFCNQEVGYRADRLIELSDYASKGIHSLVWDRMLTPQEVKCLRSIDILKAGWKNDEQERRHRESQG